jgi:chromosome segregation ATPase
MSSESDQDTGQPIEAAERELQQAADSAKAAEQRATAEIRALEADLERERLQAAERLKELRGKHEEELERERSAKERAIAAAESRLAEIEDQAEAAERRVEEAEGRAADVRGTVADADARVRESAAAWLRGQVEAIRREAGRR